MRVLTVRQPWAWAIIHGGKNVENRVRNIAGAYRGPVAIHAGLRYDERTDLGRWPFHAAMESAVENARGEVHGGVFAWDLGQPDPRRWLHELGSIIGVIDLADVHRAGTCYAESIERAAGLYRTDRDAFDALPVMNGSGGVLSRADYCSPWAEETGHHLVLSNPRALAEPILYRGALGLRELDVETAARIEAAIA